MDARQANGYVTPFTTTPSLLFHDKWNGTSSMLSTINLYSSTSSRSSSASLTSDSRFFHERLPPETFTLHSGLASPIGPSTDQYLGPCQDRNTYARMSPVYGAPKQGTRAQGPLDTRDLSPHSPGYACLPSTLDEQLSTTNIKSAASYFHSDKAVTSDPTRGFSVLPKPHVVPGFVPGLDSGFWSSTGYHRANPSTFNSLPSPPVFALAEGVTEPVGNDRQPPVVIYQSPEKKGSGRRRRSQHARAIDVEGIWIDEEDFYSAQGHGILSVHECQWAKSSNPCGIWIVGSRSHVGAHIRKWHRQRHASGRASCLWDGCTKTMLRDSINRHVVTVHLREGFLCQGCDQEFSRHDIYDDHAEKDKKCKDAGVVMVYGTERKVINTSRTLHRDMMR